MSASNIPLWKDRLRQERIRHNWRQQDLADHLGTTALTVQRWERGSHRPSAYFRVKLCALFDKSAEELGLVSDEEPFSFSPKSLEVWSVPYPRNPFFTGREDVLSFLHSQLQQEPATAVSRAWALTGLGGIGKTQIALEYAYRYAQDYRFVFWTHAATREVLQAEMMTMAELLQLNKHDEHDHQKALQAVKAWLATHQQWLWLLDDADDVATVFEVMPTALRGHLLLTSRTQAWGTLAQCLEIETMGEAEGMLYLLRRAKLLAPLALIDQVSQDVHVAAAAIVMEMGALPLALDQAGAYIEEVGCDLSAYLDLYRTHQQAMLQRRGCVPTDHTAPVATTWSLSFERIAQTHPAAADLLRLCAFLEADGIPEELILQGSAYFGNVLQQATSDAFLLNEAIEVLRRSSLIQRSAAMHMLRVHPLVQTVLKSTLDTETQRCWAERAVRATHAVFPGTVETTTWSHCQRFLPQALACAGLIRNYAFAFEEAVSLLVRIVTALQVSALYAQAEPLSQHALDIQERRLGPEHPEVARSLHHLAELYREQGKYEQAEPLYQQAWHIWEQAPRPEQADLIPVLSDLAFLYYEQGKYGQAEPLYQQAWHIWEQVPGSDLLMLATVFNNLALLYDVEGNDVQAEVLCRQAWRMREQVLGPEHPDVAISLNNLAVCYNTQGKYEQAEPLCQRAWHIWERSLGREHPIVATSLNNLALIYYGQGKYAQAEIFYQRAWHMREQALGPRHPDVAISLNRLANLYREQGRYERAESLYQRGLSLRVQALGQEHPVTAETLHDLAVFRQKQGKLHEALSFAHQALKIRSQSLGEQHRNTLATHALYTWLVQMTHRE